MTSKYYELYQIFISGLIRDTRLSEDLGRQITDLALDLQYSPIRDAFEANNKDKINSLLASLSENKKAESHVTRFYLALEEKFKGEGWSSDIKAEEKLELYQGGVVFRGDDRPPKEIFTSGFQLRDAPRSFRKASSYITDGEGVSFSTNLDVAKHYAAQAAEKGQGSLVYIVDIPSNAHVFPVDVLGSGVKKGKVAKYSKKYEVNTMRGVDAKHVMGVVYYNEKGRAINAEANPSYDGRQSLKRTLELLGMPHLGGKVGVPETDEITPPSSPSVPSISRFTGAGSSAGSAIGGEESLRDDEPPSVGP